MSGGSRYRHLFTPLEIGPITARNRIVFAAHLTNFAEDGLPSDQHVAYYEARAKGGTGLIITEEHSTHPSDWPYEKLIHGFHADVIPGYRRITEAVHRHGTPILGRSTTTAVKPPACSPGCRSGPHRQSPTRCSGRWRRG